MTSELCPFGNSLQHYWDRLSPKERNMSLDEEALYSLTPQVIAAEIAKGGEIFVFKMDSLQIKDLIEAAVEIYANNNGKKKSDVKIVNSKIRLGEKLHEDLIAKGEAAHIYETETMYIIIPQITQILAEIDNVKWEYPLAKISKYNSNQGEHMNYVDIVDLLKKVENNS